ncbi:MAG: SdrD B-like domain-containing protein [Saprospiraceae bacterium]
MRWDFPECAGDLDINLVVTFRYLLEAPLPAQIQLTSDALDEDLLLQRYDNGPFAAIDPESAFWIASGLGPTDCNNKITPSKRIDSPRPATGGDTNSSKWVQGAEDPNFSRYPDFGATNLEGDGIYEIFISSTNFAGIEQLDVVDVLPFVGDKDLLADYGRGSAWSAELASAIVIERFKIGTGLVAVGSGELPFGVMYTTSENPCYLDAADYVVADVSVADFGATLMPPSPCSDFSIGVGASGARGFLFRWSNVADPLDFGEYLKITVDIRQLSGEADAADGEVAWNSMNYTATRVGNATPLLSTGPLKVGLAMDDPTQTATIGDYVWLDANNNGRQDVGEMPFGGVGVSLYDAAGNPVTKPNETPTGTTNLPVTTTTDENGYYCFRGLTPNTDYYVRLDDETNFGNGGILASYALTTANASGIADDVDSDATMGTLAGATTSRPQIFAPTMVWN